MRPGRLDRLVYVPLPDENTRKEIFDLRLSSVPLSEDVNIGELVKLTHRYSGAEVGTASQWCVPGLCTRGVFQGCFPGVSHRVCHRSGGSDL